MESQLSLFDESIESKIQKKMKIQKYKAKIKNTDVEVVGYITEGRKYLSDGCYNNEIEYVISVTSISMPNGKYGTFIVDKESIKPV